jgi:hypothetical protein
MKDVGEMAEIRRDLREMRFYIDDPELREEVSTWISQSHERSDADTAQEYVERKLNELLAEYPMYHDPALTRGEDGFPDACADCRHYGSACPVLTDNVETEWRERALDQAETEAEARRVYQQQALDVSCKQIPAFLSEWDNEHADLVHRGEELLDRVEAEIHGERDAAEPTADDLETVATDGGGSS